LIITPAKKENEKSRVDNLPAGTQATVWQAGSSNFHTRCFIARGQLQFKKIILQ
jgi:hypothetical protein